MRTCCNSIVDQAFNVELNGMESNPVVFAYSFFWEIAAIRMNYSFLHFDAWQIPFLYDNCNIERLPRRTPHDFPTLPNFCVDSSNSRRRSAKSGSHQFFQFLRSVL
mmetsp:Transcript_57090/g.84973  ORF Transcript_57090/g.84973 Transcript_57090/m.84973 type:complete len:106 (+) Transcript_57090:40-357(+)